MIHMILAGMIFLFSCNSSDIPGSFLSAGNNQQGWKKLHEGSQCSKEEAANLLINSQAELDKVWSTAFVGDMMPDKPSVDFSKNSVVAVFLGMVNSGGHSIELKSIRAEEGQQYIIEVVHKLPGKSCLSTMAIEFPYFIALTDNKLGGTAKFAISKQEVECE